MEINNVNKLALERNQSTEEDLMKTNRFVSLYLLCVLFLLTWSCGQDSLVVESSRDGHLDLLTIQSKVLGEEKDIYVFLPPGYDASGQKYSVIYYLHGHAADATELLGFERSIFSVMQQGKVKKFILVAVNGDNRLGGTFYVNSTKGGMWEDHFIQELVPLIDKRYRTVASAQGRGLMGFSMGGFGVLRLGLAYPDLFGAVWALCPGVFVPEKGLRDAMTTWKRFGGSFLDSYAAAFSKEAKIPSLDGSAEDAAVAAEWEAGFGGWEKRIADYKNKQSTLRAIRIIFGENDMYGWITDGSKYLAEYMGTQGLPAEIYSYPIGHRIGAGTVVDDAMPFFGKNLPAE